MRLFSQECCLSSHEPGPQESPVSCTGQGHQPWEQVKGRLGLGQAALRGWCQAPRAGLWERRGQGVGRLTTDIKAADWGGPHWGLPARGPPGAEGTGPLTLAQAEGKWRGAAV